MTSDSCPTQIIAARWILPITHDPVSGGWIRVRGRRVVELGCGKPPASAHDLGDVAILPGLVNAHTHLEFSDCEQPIGHRGMRLADWIGRVIQARSATDPDSTQAVIHSGIEESMSAGVRLIGEISTPPSEVTHPDMQFVRFAEVLGLQSDRYEERLSAAVDHNAIHCDGGWSPHAPYSTPRSVIHACVDQAAKTNRPLAMHVAESPDERELLLSGTGPFADTLKAIGAWRNDLFPWGGSPFVELIRQLSASPHALIVHGNDLRREEIRELAQHDNLTVVYCPRTHDFFGYDLHPIADLLSAGVRVALGTDSRASNPDLNLWKEVQFVLNHRVDVSPDRVLAAATLNGADALLHKRLGRIQVDAEPGFGFVETSASTVEQLMCDMATNPYQPLR